MGCGGSKDKEEGLHADLKYTMRELGVENLDNLFKDAAEVIKQLEEIRVAIVDNRDDLVINSGACSLSEPTLKDCMMGIVWKLSADNKGSFKDSGMTPDLDAKKIVLNGKGNSKEAKTAIDSLNNYYNGIMNLPDKMKELSDKIMNLGNQFTDNMTTYTSELSDKFMSSPLKIPGKLSDLKDNAAKVSTAASIATKLSEELKNNLSFLKESPKMMSNVEEITKIDVMGKKANTEKLVRPYEIVWGLADVKRRYQKKPEDGLRLWEQRKKNKSESKARNKK